MSVIKKSVLRDSKAGRRVMSVFLAAVVLALGIFRGAEFCFCARVESAEHGHAHCLACDPCGADETFSPVAESSVLAADAEECDHLVVVATDLYLASQTDAAWNIGCDAVLPTFAHTVVLTRAAAVLPPSTAPPESGDSFLSYRNRIFLRS
ncbi:MAG: hypothetical protein ACI4R9_00310 [Kiritimatiellia bacterium]